MATETYQSWEVKPQTYDHAAGKWSDIEFGWVTRTKEVADKPDPVVTKAQDTKAVAYLDANPDVKEEYKKQKDAGSTQSSGDFAEQHYENYGKSEGREYENITPKSDNDYLEYVLSNPDLRENAEASGLTQDEAIKFGKQHYDTWGHLEGRANAPGAITLKSAYGEELGPQHYTADVWAGMSPEEILAQTVTGTVTDLLGGESDLWKARAALGGRDSSGNLIDPGTWSLSGFTADEWNMDPDIGYRAGAFEDVLDVNRRAGQLYLTKQGLIDPITEEKVNDNWLQERYNEGYEANDFPEAWVTDGKWTGPDTPALNEYWNLLTWDEETQGERPPPSWQGKGLLGPDYYAGFDPSRGGFGTEGGVGPGVGGLIATTPYTQPAPQDWSKLRYTYAGSPLSELGQMTQTPASRAMFGDEGAAMQPWTTGQGVPPGLINYQIPGGPQANVTFTGANPGLFDFSANGAGTGNGGAVNGGETSKTHWEIMADHYDLLNIPHVGGVPTATANGNKS